MPRKTVPCATCGKAMQPGSTSLPEGQSRCRQCRSDTRSACTDCSGPVSHGSTRCWSCHLQRVSTGSAAAERRLNGGGQRRIVINGKTIIDPRHSRSWRQLRDQVVYEEPLCALRLGDCTAWSTTADHVLPVSQRPDLALERTNLRGACHSCNERRGAARTDQKNPGPQLARGQARG